MPIFKKAFLFWLCASFLCMQIIYTSATAVAGVTTTEIETVNSGEVKIPTETVTSPEKGGGNWLWALLGVALVGGAAAALMGGGRDKEDSSPDPETGDATITW